MSANTKDKLDEFGWEPIENGSTGLYIKKNNGKKTKRIKKKRNISKLINGLEIFKKEKKSKE